VRDNFEFRFQHLQNAVNIAENLIVPNPNCPIPKPAQHRLALAIGGAVRVLAAIDLNNEMRISTSEICEIRPDRFLTHELPVAKISPKQQFGPRAPPPLPSGSLGRGVVGPRIVAPHPAKEERESRGVLPKLLGGCGGDAPLAKFAEHLLVKRLQRLADRFPQHRLLTPRHHLTTECRNDHRRPRTA
jgi:hypothetical protein